MKKLFSTLPATTGLILWSLATGSASQLVPLDGATWERGLSKSPSADAKLEASTLATLREGRRVFRYDTFGDEAFWGGALKLHQAVAGANLGGIGGGVSPSTALAVGLKVDVEALPESLKQRLRAGKVDLNDPAS